MTTLKVAIAGRPMIEFDEKLPLRTWLKIRHEMPSYCMVFTLLGNDGKPWGHIPMTYTVVAAERNELEMFQILRSMWATWVQALTNAHERKIKSHEHIFKGFGRPAYLQIEYDPNPPTLLERLLV
jgi:hypothetical protein